MAKEERNRALDGLRGIAILAVLASHLSVIGGVPLFPLTGFRRWMMAPAVFGWWGVDLFFVLSGFLITGILVRTRAATNRASSFYTRRFLRIFPIYYLTLFVILLVALWSPWIASLLESKWRERLVYFVYLQNWRVVWHNTPEPSMLGHFWSLAVEEQFYLVWPVLVWTMSNKNVLRLSIVGAACALLLRILLVVHYGPHLWIHMLTPCRGEGLLIGSALAVVAAEKTRVPRKVIWFLGAFGIAIMLLIAALDKQEFLNTDAGPYMYTVGVSGLGLLFGALVASSQYAVPVWTKFLDLPTLRIFGKYSYGIYVYHLPVILITASLLANRGWVLPLSPLPALALASLLLALTFVIAWISFEFLEKKLLRIKSSFEPRFETRATELLAR